MECSETIVLFTCRSGSSELTSNHRRHHMCTVIRLVSKSKNNANLVLTSGGSRISRGGGANSPGGAPTYNFAKFSQKLHEFERIWTPGGARVQNFTM